ncbi:hypothetical protein BaRGS_00018680, partial [Batillaria attramentaria]
MYTTLVVCIRVQSPVAAGNGPHDPSNDSPPYSLFRRAHKKVIPRGRGGGGGVLAEEEEKKGVPE